MPLAADVTLEVTVTNGGVPLGHAALALREGVRAEDGGRRVVMAAGFFAPLAGYAPLAEHASEVLARHGSLPTGPIAVQADAELPHLPSYTLRLPLALVGRDGVEMPAATISLMQHFRERHPRAVHVFATFDDVGAPVGALLGARVRDGESRANE